MDEWRWSRDPDGSYYASRVGRKDWVRARYYKRLWRHIDALQHSEGKGDLWSILQCTLETDRSWPHQHGTKSEWDKCVDATSELLGL